MLNKVLISSILMVIFYPGVHMKQFVLVMVSASALLFGASQNDEIEKLSRQIGDQQHFAKLFYKRASLYALGGEYTRAIEDYEKTELFVKGYKDVEINLLQMYLANKQAQKVVDLAPEMIKDAKDDAARKVFELVYADALIRLQRYDEGISIYQGYSKSKGGLSDEESVRMANAYEMMGDSRNSNKVLKAALRHDPNNYRLNEKLVLVSLDDGSYSLAETIIERMVKSQENPAKTYYLQARLYEEKEQFDKALESSHLARSYFNKISEEQRFLAENRMLEKNIKALELKLGKKTV